MSEEFLWEEPSVSCIPQTLVLDSCAITLSFPGLPWSLCDVPWERLSMPERFWALRAVPFLVREGVTGHSYFPGSLCLWELGSELSDPRGAEGPAAAYLPLTDISLTRQCGSVCLFVCFLFLKLEKSSGNIIRPTAQGWPTENSGIYFWLVLNFWLVYIFWKYRNGEMIRAQTQESKDFCLLALFIFWHRVLCIAQGSLELTM